MKEKRLFWIFSAVLVVGVALIYGQTGCFEQLSYDDDGYTLNCRFVKDGLSVDNVLTSFKDLTWGGIYMPITYSSYMAVISAFGPSHGAQHLVSAFFHAINAVLFFLFLLRLAGWGREPGDERRVALPIVFFAAALWAWHPLRVESVAWIASRKDTLFTMFTLLGLFAWMDRRNGRAYLMMLCGCLSKPTAMVFPALAICIDFLCPKVPQDKTAPRTKHQALSTCLRYLPLVILSAATAILATYSQTHGTGEDARGLFYSTFSWRLLNALVSLGIYFYHFIVPVGLQFWYRPIRGGLPLHTPLALITLGVVTAAWCIAFWRCRDRRRVLLVTAFWFCAGIGPTLGVAASFGNHAFADRFTYLPMMAVSILIVFLLPGVKFLNLKYFVLLMPLLAFAALAFDYTRTYRNNLTAFENVARWDPNHCYAWTNIGSETILRTGDFKKGIECFRRSLALFPTDEAENQLATALISVNDPKDEDEIVRLCMKGADWKTSPKEGVIPLIPAEKDKDGFRMEALGVISTRHRDWPNAIRCFETALSREPREDTRMRLAMCYWNLKRHDEAIPHLRILERSQRPDISAKARELLMGVR